MIAFETLVFYLFSVVAVLAALGVVLSRNPVHAALFLVLVFVASAVVWLLLRAEFLAIALVLVYVGAVMVLFLFVLMMLDVNVDLLREGFWRFFPLAVIVAALLVVQVFFVLSTDSYPQTPLSEAEQGDNTRALGLILYTNYVYPFQLAAVVLLVAMIAAVALTLRRSKRRHVIDPAAQVQVAAKDRLRVVSLPHNEREQSR